MQVNGYSENSTAFGMHYSKKTIKALKRMVPDLIIYKITWIWQICKRFKSRNRIFTYKVKCYTLHLLQLISGFDISS